MNGIDEFIVAALLIGAAAIVTILVAAGVERARQREARRAMPRPRIPASERALLGDNWMATARRKNR